MKKRVILNGASALIFLICFAILASSKQGLRKQDTRSSGPRIKFVGNYRSCDEARNSLSHTLERIGSSGLKLDPFPHLIVDQVFTDIYYEHIMRNIINATESTLFKKRGPLKPRYSLSLDNSTDQLRRAKTIELKEKISFWKCHYQIFEADEFTEQIMNSFSSVLRKRLGRDYFSKQFSAQKSLKNGPLFFQKINLVQDRDKYFISPHTDVAEKVITMLFYVAPIVNEDRLRDAGTLLLKPISQKTNNKDVCDLNSFRRICKYVKFQGKYYSFKQCEFKPNRLIAFAPCHSAWHGVPLQNLGGSPRNTIQSFIGSTITFPLGRC